MKTQKIAAGILLAGGLLLQTMSAQADLKYTKEMRMGDDPKAAPMQTITTAIRQNARREETRMSIGPMQSTSVVLTLCEKRQSITLDPGLKMYTESPLDENGQPANSAPATPGRRDGGPSGTGKIVMTTTVKDLGEETVAGFKARHYMINNKMNSSGCAGKGETEMKMEIWVTDIREPMACETGYSDPARSFAMPQSNCKITFEYNGDKDAYTKAYSGLILRMKMGAGDTVMVHDTTMLSQAKIEDDSLFSVPADYKKVTPEELQQAQTKAMMEAMMGGAKKAKNNKNKPADDEEEKDEGATEQKDKEGDDTPEDTPKEEPKKDGKKDKDKKKDKGFKLPRLPF